MHSLNYHDCLYSFNCKLVIKRPLSVRRVTIPQTHIIGSYQAIPGGYPFLFALLPLFETTEAS